MSYRVSVRLLGAIATVLLLYCILAYSLEAVCYWLPDWYRNEYEKYNVLEDVRGEMSMDDAVYVTTEMLQYLRGNRDDLVIYTTIDGKRCEFYSDREKAHLADCRELFVGGLCLRRISLFAIAVILAIMYALRKRNPDEESLATSLARSYVRTTSICLGISLILLLAAMQDFTAFFDGFHKLFFDNDLYLLDPREDNLINLLPEGFFSDTAAAILGLFLTVAVVLFIVSLVLLAKNRKERGRINGE